MTLKEVLNHVFSEEDLNREVTAYSVYHSETQANYEIDVEEDFNLKIGKKQNVDNTQAL